MKRILKVMSNLKTELNVAIIFSIVYESIKVLPIFALKKIIDSILLVDSTLKEIFFLIGIFFFFLIVNNIISVVADVYYSKKVVKNELNFLELIEKKMLSLDIEYHEKNDTGSQISKIIKGANKLSEYSFYLVMDMFPIILQSIITIIIIFYQSPLIGVTYFLFSVLSSYTALYFTKKIQPFRLAWHKEYDGVVGVFAQSLLNIRTIKDFVREKYEASLLKKGIDKSLALFFVRISLHGKVEITRELLVTFGRISVIALAALFFFQNKITPGTFILIYTMSEKGFINLSRLGRTYTRMADAADPIIRVLDIFDNEPVIKEKKGAIRIKKVDEIIFDNVSYSYLEGVPVLKKINMKVPKNKIIALVGKSGSGKSTFVQLLMRHRDVEKGTILINGNDVREYNVADYRKRFSVVSQNIEIFNRSVKDNILFGEDMKREDLITKSKLAHAHEFIDRMPNKYNTLVGEDGLKLSGGQKQRLSIARALIGNPDILIFDEATSALDTESEKLIQKAIFGLRGKKTMIIIAHRLSTIEKADEIYVFDNGRIVEHGSYQDLIKSRGVFKKMVDLQTMGELRD